MAIIALSLRVPHQSAPQPHQQRHVSLHRLILPTVDVGIESDQSPTEPWVRYLEGNGHSRLPDFGSPRSGSNAKSRTPEPARRAVIRIHLSVND
jgi:hypothetical protein